jgi:sulfopyruvate decarboxylase subunit alpha
MDVNDQIHAQLIKAGIRLAATLPDDWVNSLIRRVAKDNVIRHVSVGREAETIAVCAGAFFGGVRAVAIMGNTGLLTCTGEMATLCLRHAIPVFCIVSGRGSIDRPTTIRTRSSTNPMRSRPSPTPTNGIDCRSGPSSCS